MIWTVIYDDRTVGEVMTNYNDYSTAFAQAEEPGHNIVAILKGRHASVCRFTQPKQSKGAQLEFEYRAP